MVPLDPSELQKSLGPGYRKGWYGWGSLGERKGDCVVGNRNRTYILAVSAMYERVKAELVRKQTLEEFYTFLEKKYHNMGHMVIARGCSPKFEPPSRFMGAMAFSEVSARDPIFWRWHGHIEDTAQAFRDRQLPL